MADGDASVRGSGPALRAALAGSLTVAFALLGGEALAVPEGRKNQLSLDGTIVNMAIYIGPWDRALEGKIDTSSGISPGVSVSYARSFSPYFELRPRFEYLPLLEVGGHELRWLLDASGVLPLVDGWFDLSLGVRGGVALLSVQGDDAFGPVVGPALGVRPWVTEQFGFYADFFGGYGYFDGDAIKADHVQLLKVALGASVAF